MENQKNPEKKVSSGERSMAWMDKKERVVEKKEISVDEKKVSEELRREIEMLAQGDEAQKKLAGEKANKIKFYANDDKINHLLAVAKQSGVLVAVKMAMDMNDPYLLDLFHDVMAREGFYKKFIKVK